MQSDKLFSERQKEFRGEVPDVYQYDAIPRELRNQIIHIWRYAFGKPDRGSLGDLRPINIANAYEFIHEALCYRYGEAGLGHSRASGHDAIHSFLLVTEDTERVIDVIEVSFRYIDTHVRNHPDNFPRKTISPDKAIAGLNYWFRERGVGYRYESGQIIRVDSEFIHSEVVKLTLIMLSDSMYEGANAEFLSAHEHYRKGRYKECMNECLKAFESCIKAICGQRGWDYNDGDTINRLIAIVFDKELIPDFMQSHFSGLRSTLEAGVPTLRNRLSGHGDGTEEVPVQEYIAAYTLHLTASNILFLAKANEEMK